MNFTLDMAAVLGVVVWPLILFWLVRPYRGRLPALLDRIVNRVQKVEVAGVSVELAVAKPIVPDWTAAPGGPDLRHAATAAQLNDSDAATFRSQLMDDRDADYALLNLGSGESWLTSRLFIMAILFGQMKGIDCFVFVERNRTSRKQYVGWADPNRIRWRLAQHYPWLEQAYAVAYSHVMSMKQPKMVVVSHDGRIGASDDHWNAKPRIDLLNAFLVEVQRAAPDPQDDARSWVQIQANQLTYEHASWIGVDDLDEMLDDDLHSETASLRDVRAKGSDVGLRAILSVPAHYVAVVGDAERFEYLIDRARLLEQMADRPALTKASESVD